MPTEHVDISKTPAPDQQSFDIKMQDYRVYRMVYYILGVMEVVFLLRFCLKLLGANPVNIFATFIYILSAVFVAPFGTLFQQTTIQQTSGHSVLEPGTLVAMVVYALLAVAIAKLILIVRSRPGKTK